MKVALVGLGAMGVPIAERVLAAGHELTVWNRSPGKADGLVAQGASLAESAKGLLGEVDVCITMVADDAALEAVTNAEDGVLAGTGPGTVLIDMSTVSPAASARVAEAAERARVDYLRAPVSGNPGVVRAGNLTIIVSGPEGAFERVRELLEAIGPNVYYVGGADEARVLKLALQVMIAGTTELMAEALVLAEGSGLDRAKLLEVMGASAVGSPFVKYKTGPILANDYSATFTTKAMLKDVSLVLGVAEETGLPLPVTSMLRSRLRETIDAGYGDADLMALLLQLRQAAGLPG